VTPAARRLLALLLLDVRGLMRALESGATTVAAWQQQFSAALAKYHTASYIVGAGDRTIDKTGRGWLGRHVASQIGFLKNFATEIQDNAQFKPGWNARAAMYAKGIGASFWKGQTRMLPLPAMPADGTTQCKTNCGCSWSIEELDGDGNYDCYWRLGKSENCQTCATRARDWAPYRVRNGKAV
jgi:hypothetical protein